MMTWFLPLPGLKTGGENDWSEIRSGFREPRGTPPPRIPRSTTPPPPPTGGIKMRVIADKCLRVEKWVVSFPPAKKTRLRWNSSIQQILNWHWLSCLPSISVELVCDNTFNIDIALGNAADVAWIRGFQVHSVNYFIWLPILTCFLV